MRGIVELGESRDVGTVAEEKNLDGSQNDSPNVFSSNGLPVVPMDNTSTVPPLGLIGIGTLES